MAFRYDPEIEAALTTAFAAAGPMVPLSRGDWRGRRDRIDAMMAAQKEAAPPLPEVTIRPFSTEAADGAALSLRWYARADAAPGSAVVYLHGGGMICGSVDLYDPVVSAYVALSGVPMLSVEYRLAPEHPHPVPLEDAYAGLCWLVAQASALGIDPQRIAVMGDSAGGGLAAGVALLARDRGIALARQILIYPMLDDRTVDADPLLEPFASWTYDDNFTGWQALLGDRMAGDTVPPPAAPARAADLAGLAPAYIEVGELDIFRDEDIRYARRLAAAGVSAELHVLPGTPHGFERIAPESAAAKRALADRLRILKGL